MLIVNADPNPGNFYVTPINGLCENTTYEFSSWLINLLPSNHNCDPQVPINVRFEIWDNTNTTLLAAGDTGAIYSTATANWQQYGLVFQTVSGQTSVILKMKNNGAGGCGNDLAIDDIMFRTCGDRIIIQDSLNNSTVYLCENNLPYSATLTAAPNYAIFSSHYYQWQESNDAQNWNNIPNENNQSYTVSSINRTTFYRVLVAEDEKNLFNNSCNSSSEIFEIIVVPQPDTPISNGDLNLCQNDATPLTVTTPSDIDVNWYDSQTGGQLLKANSNAFSPMVSGTYYAESQNIKANCRSTSRTAVSVNYYELPMVNDEILEFCENTTTRIHANVINQNVVERYLWNTGEVTEFIDVNTAGTYTVEVYNNSCAATKTITLNQINNPSFLSVGSNGNDIIITPNNTGDFEYSLDGIVYQTSTTFKNIVGGLYTIYAKEKNCPGVITTTYIHFYIPKYFTPNGDHINDTFNLAGIEHYKNSSVTIFDRYGKLLKRSINMPFSWDGSMKGKQLPTGDYWYIIVIDGQKTTGHFTLKR